MEQCYIINAVNRTIPIFTNFTKLTLPNRSNAKKRANVKSPQGKIDSERELTSTLKAGRIEVAGGFLK
jgi:hypothetical protein